MIDSPESAYLPVPVDLQNATYLQFGVLREQGYPVALEPCSPETAKAQYEQIGELGKRMAKLTAYFPEWITPQVIDPAFAQRIGELGLAGPALPVEERLRLALENHPATLVKAVDWGEVYQIANYGAKLKAGIRPETAAPIDIRKLLPSLFMTAMRRRQMFEGRIHLPKLRESDQSAYEAFLKKRIRPTSDERLRTLVVDYYKFLTHRSTSFGRFRHFTR